jgi:CRISPR-associated protein Cmr1
MTNTITFTCQTITPMFLHGADGTTPELRPASIKGVLRFWWRAAHGHLPLAQLKELEAAIFGSTDQKLGRSPFSIRILDFRHQFKATETSNISPLPHKEPVRFTLSAIPVGIAFRVQFSFYKMPTIEGKKFDTQALQNLFELVSLLGGLGKRVRRGFGSFKITHVQIGKNAVTPLQVDYSLANIQHLYTTLTGQSLTLNNNTLQHPNKEGRENFPYIKKIRLGNVTHPNLLTKIGRATSTTKASNNDSWDYRNAIGHAMGQSRLASPVFVSAVGLPNGLLPIITTLNMAWENNRRSNPKHQEIQEQFQRNIL